MPVNNETQTEREARQRRHARAAGLWRLHEPDRTETHADEGPNHVDR